MKRAYLLPALALLGVVIAVIAVVDTNRPVAVQPPAVAPAQSPFASYVAGMGITEIGRGNIAIATTVAGVVSEIYVRVGDAVAAGEPLFKIDDRDLQAGLQVELAKAEEAQAAFDKPRHRLDYFRHLARLDPGAVSAQTLSELRDDAAAAESAVESAKAAVAQTRIEIERRVVRAPAAGRILQINTRVGEYAATSGLATPLMLMGDDTRMYVRVDVDESDAWRIRPEAAAQAIVRGNPTLKTALRFEYIEPYVAPKTSLTGQSTERSDVRVLQVIYSFERKTLPVYVGQQMDVFIQAPPLVKPRANGAR
jgi:multidrug resistance efflux pump